MQLQLDIISTASALQGLIALQSIGLAEQRDSVAKGKIGLKLLRHGIDFDGTKVLKIEFAIIKQRPLNPRVMK